MASSIVQSIDRFLAIPAPPKEPLIDGLLYRRDLVILAGRRRNGKTALLLNLAHPLVAGADSFLGYPILGPIRVLAFLLEDDTRELQDKLQPMLQSRALDYESRNRFALYTGDHFLSKSIPLGIQSELFREEVTDLCSAHSPDLIVLDNAAALISGDVNNARIVHQLTRLCYGLSQKFNAALLLAAHPRKRGEIPVSLRSDPESFFEEVMGHSHLINSFGSLWGLQRNQDNLTYFLAGSQRFLGTQSMLTLTLDENRWFVIGSDHAENLSLACSSAKRRKAWGLLPVGRELTFNATYQLVRSHLSSKQAFSDWWKQLIQLGLLSPGPGASYLRIKSSNPD